MGTIRRTMTHSGGRASQRSVVVEIAESYLGTAVYADIDYLSRLIGEESAVAWRHGMALGTEVYSQYGAGWPLLLNAISRWFPLGHQNAVELAMLYGCIYHAGLYVLLRVAVGSRTLALGGTLGILAVSVFSPFIDAQANLSTIWQWPSLSVRGLSPSCCQTLPLITNL